MTARKAGPSFSRVVMSLKRIPSVGKFLMSRIFARSSVTSIARYLNRQSAVSHNQESAGEREANVVRWPRRTAAPVWERARLVSGGWRDPRRGSRHLYGGQALDDRHHHTGIVFTRSGGQRRLLVALGHVGKADGDVKLLGDGVER